MSNSLLAKLANEETESRGFMRVNPFDSTGVHSVSSLEEVHSTSTISRISEPPATNMEAFKKTVEMSATQLNEAKAKALKELEGGSTDKPKPQAIHPTRVQKLKTDFSNSKLGKVSARIAEAIPKWLDHEMGKTSVTNSTKGRKTIIANLKSDLKLLAYELPPIGVKNFINSLASVSDSQMKSLNSDHMRDKTYLDRIGDVVHVGLAALVLPIYTVTYVVATPLIGPIYLGISAFQKAAENFASAYEQTKPAKWEMK